MKHENKWGLEDLDETPYKAAGSPRHAAMTIEEQQTKHEGTLEEILAGAKRIKNTAGGLNNEVVAQNHLIQDISQNATQATSEVERQASVAAAVTKKRKQLCFYYTIIVVLIVVLFLILYL
ncbi:hypothetical protein H257_09154 [Aphanomyces astaci]|uniref:t-SNARE coiled-coil homology domain-containing protein n=1 Tax=Aphanomyces astaci TaxID=112090 RepID=W4GAH9_APHAT|nr:hypothetical protein H257_09154 [Aphanomyces astaci]ETV76670.1 hypothetical protein H257_09154 [Aphanomyces astaci]|eukprot:XP_009833583.1 hypothetical protein H257_09154 [Aphanomyces astaci]